MREYIIELPLSASIVNYASRICDGDECLTDVQDFKQSAVYDLTYRVYCAHMMFLTMMNEMYATMVIDFRKQGINLDEYYKVFTVDIQSVTGDPTEDQVDQFESLKPGVRSLVIPYKYYFRITSMIDIEDDVIDLLRTSVSDYVKGDMSTYLALPASTNKTTAMEKIIIFNYHLSQAYPDESETVMTDGIKADRAAFNATFLQERPDRGCAINTSQTSRLINVKIIDKIMHVDLSPVINYNEIHNYLLLQ